MACTYCHMENIEGCGGGGWTLVMKIDGAKVSFTSHRELLQRRQPRRKKRCFKINLCAIVAISLVQIIKYSRSTPQLDSNEPLLKKV